jgi:hypothetical protein
VIANVDVDGPRAHAATFRSPYTLSKPGYRPAGLADRWLSSTPKPPSRSRDDHCSIPRSSPAKPVVHRRARRSPPGGSRRRRPSGAPRSGAPAAECIGRAHEFTSRARFERRVAGVAYDAQPCLGPGAVQGPGAAHGADDVVAALDDDCRNFADAVHVVEQLTIATQEAAVDEIVASDARQRSREAGAARLRDLPRADCRSPRSRCGDARRRAGSPSDGAQSRSTEALTLV